MLANDGQGYQCWQASTPQQTSRELDKQTRDTRVNTHKCWLSKSHLNETIVAAGTLYGRWKPEDGCPEVY